MPHRPWLLLLFVGALAAADGFHEAAFLAKIKPGFSGHPDEEQLAEVAKIIEAEGGGLSKATRTDLVFRSCRIQRKPLVLALLASGPVDVKARAEHTGRNLLQWTLSTGYLEATRILLEEKGFDPVAIDPGYFPYMVGVIESCGNVLRDHHRRVAEIAAAKAAGKDVSQMDDRRAVLDRCRATRDLLLAHKLDPNARHPSLKSPLLHLAAERGDVDSMQALLRAGADPTLLGNQGRSLVFMACVSGDPLVLRWVQERFPKQPLPEEALRFAQTPDAVKGFLALGAQLDGRDESHRTALHRAAGEGQADLVKALIEAGADLDLQRQCESHVEAGGTLWRPPGGDTALVIALDANEAETARLLIEAGADLSLGDDFGKTPLHHAAGFGGVGAGDLVRLLLKKGADPKAVTHQDRSKKGVAGRTPLHEACKAGNLEAAKLLLEQGVPVDAKDAEGRTPYMDATERGSDQVMAALAEAGADVSKGDHLRMAAKEFWFSDPERFFKLVKEVPEVLDDPQLVFHCFDRGPDERLLQLVPLLPDLDIRARWHSGDDTEYPLLYRVIGRAVNRWELVRVLVEHGAKVDVVIERKRMRPTSIFLGLVEALAEQARGEAQCRKDTPRYADHEQQAKNRAMRLELVTLFLEKGADAAWTPERGVGPLGVAVSHSMQPAIVRLLLEKGADPQAALKDWGRQGMRMLCPGDRINHALLLVAAEADAEALARALEQSLAVPKAVTLLLEAGARVDPPQETPQVTPLMTAAGLWNLTTLELLLDAGADVDRVDRRGWNALHHAEYHLSRLHGGELSDGAVRQVLLDAGIKPTGITPAQWAFKVALDHRETKRALQLIRADTDLAKGWPALLGDPLIPACALGSAELATALLAAGIDPDVKDDGGRTALMHATRAGNRDLVKTLLAGGADPGVQDRQGKVAADYAPE